MSGLIFEGDTTQRFGEKFPKPFIQEIRVFDNAIEADIVLFFKVSLEENVEENAKFFKDDLSDYELYSGFGSTASRNSMVEFDLVDGEIFNSEGVRFIKLILEKRIDHDFLSGAPEYFYCCSTLRQEESSNLNITQDLTNIDPTGGYNKITNSSSPLVYERVYRADGTLSSDSIEAYQELDGNIYGQTPLMSLDRRYRKTDNITHKTIIDNVNAVIAPYVGTEITEADNIAVTLQTHKDDPRLLVKLSKQTKNFSNKSSVTATGILYISMVNNIGVLDNALLLEDVLEKRRFANAKIKDRRGDISLIKDNDFTEGLFTGLSYIYKPLISRGVVNFTGKRGLEEDANETYMILNQSYYFFDYEKAINYETEISNFFNPYNLLQIFGNNCLNNYFKIETSGIEKITNRVWGDSTSTTNIVLYYPTGSGGLLGGSNMGSSYIYHTTFPTENLIQQNVTETIRMGNIGTRTDVDTIYSQIVERAFDTLDSIDGYRLKCYEIVDLESFSTLEATKDSAYTFKIETKDTTMQFYKEYIQQPILKMYEDLKRYLDFADDFCSFNNIDGRFNDFFVDAVQTHFNSPFPWHEGPVLYHSVLAALQASWEELGSKDIGFETRKRNGSSVDLALVKQNAILKSKQISPSTGDLVSLQEFVSDFGKFKDYFEVGSGLDKNNEIYKTLFGGILSLKRKEISKTFEKTTPLPNQINNNISFREPVDGYHPRESFTKNSPLDLMVGRSSEEIRSFIAERKSDFIDDINLKAIDGANTVNFANSIVLTWEDMFDNWGETVDLLSDDSKAFLRILFPYMEFMFFLQEQNPNRAREPLSITNFIGEISG